MRKIVTSVCVSFFSFMFFLPVAHALLITSIWEASIDEDLYNTSLPGVNKVSWLVRFDDEDVGVIDGARVDKNGGKILASEDWIYPSYKWKPIEWIFDENLLEFYEGIPNTSINPGIEIKRDLHVGGGDLDAVTYFHNPRHYKNELMFIAHTQQKLHSMISNKEYDFLDPWEFPDVYVRGEKVGLYDISATFHHGNIELPSPVPEPATMVLFGAGLLGLAGFSIRRKKKA